MTLSNKEAAFILEIIADNTAIFTTKAVEALKMGANALRQNKEILC